jgi:putative DNA primase/helicase
VLPEVWRFEVCKGYDPKAVCHGLLEHDCLIQDKDCVFDCKVRPPKLGELDM